MKPKVAIIGARGIGRFHGRWFSIVGCDVVAFVGTSEESVGGTATEMEALFGFDGRGYVDCLSMLDRERPDIVVVSSPHACHTDHALIAARFGAHVYCEKPLVWDEAVSADENVSRAAAMVEAVERKGLLFGVNTQYAATVPLLRRFYEEIRGPLETVEEVEMHLTAKVRGRDDEGESIWVDMGAHPLSVVMGLLGEVTVLPETLDVGVSHRDVTAAFSVHPKGEPERKARVRIRVGRVEADKADLPRSVTINGLTFTLGGRRDSEGVFRAVLGVGEREEEVEDFMHTSVAAFVAAVRGDGDVIVDGRAGLENQRLLAAVLNKGRGG